MAGIGYRLARSLGQVRGAYQDQRARKAREAARAREDDWLDIQRDAWLTERGGGRGPVPMDEREIAPPPQLDEFEPPEGPLTQGPSPGLGVRAPDMAPPELYVPDVPSMTVREPDRRYQAVGDDAYIMKPGIREASAASMTADRESADRRRRVNAIGQALQTGRGMDPMESGRIAEGLEEGVDADLLMPEAEEPPTIRASGRDFPDTPEGRQAALDWRGQYADVGREEDRGGGSPGYVPTEEDLRALGFEDPAEIRMAQNDAVYRRQRVRELREGEGQWQDPPGFEDQGEERLAASFPRAVARWKESGFTEWNPDLDTQGGGEDEGPSWVGRQWDRVTGIFGGDEAQASPEDDVGDEPPPRRPTSLPGGEYTHGDIEEDEPQPAPAQEGEGGTGLEADIRDALDEGKTAEDIISELEAYNAPADVIEQARSILARIGS